MSLTDHTNHWPPVTAKFSQRRMTSTDQEKFSTAWIIDVARTSTDALLLTVTCPFCGGIHYHGLDPDADDDEPGFRVPHCAPASLYGQYRLKAASGTLADLLRAEHDTCCAVTTAGARCRCRATVRNWLCPQHADKLGGGLTVRFPYPSRTDYRLDRLAVHVVTFLAGHPGPWSGSGIEAELRAAGGVPFRRGEVAAAVRLAAAAGRVVVAPGPRGSHLFSLEETNQ